jgi:hypothetical protein
VFAGHDRVVIAFLHRHFIFVIFLHSPAVHSISPEMVKPALHAWDWPHHHPTKETKPWVKQRFRRVC